MKTVKKDGSEITQAPNLNGDFEQLFSSSPDEGLLDLSIESSNCENQIPKNSDKELCEEVFDKMIEESEIEHEQGIQFKERQVECMGPISNEDQTHLTEFCSSKMESKCIKNDIQVTIEKGLNEIEFSSSSKNELEINTIVPRRAESGEGIELSIDDIDFKSGYFKRIEEERQKALKEKDAAEKRYYVEKVEPRTDFSEYGDFADIFEEEHRQKMLEYKQNLDRVKKLKAEDKQSEKLQKQLQKQKLAKERSDRKVERTFKKLQSKMYTHGHYSKVVGFNESQTLLKLSIPRTYHRIVDKFGYIIKTAPFIELSQTKNSFYSYNPRTNKFELYANLGEVTKGNYALINVTDTQQQMWDYFKEGDKEKRFGFVLQKFDKFESSRYY